MKTQLHKKQGSAIRSWSEVTFVCKHRKRIFQTLNKNLSMHLLIQLKVAMIVLHFTWTLTKHEFSHDQSCKNATIFSAFFSSIYHELSGYVSYISLVFYTLLQEVQCTMAIFCLVNQISFIVPSWKTVQEYQLCLILKQLWPFLKPFLLIRTYFSLVNTKYIYIHERHFLDI